ncbi:MAG: ATP-binding protein, partial [Candidatus Methanomethylophilaceae archaeon]|nr:ATP-binding protein [Candidatus Methanomethylophilaceae archaeon]
TITTNIQTGENDKRMEKAVLKTIVAFLNTTGGILMIGVSDDGSIYGVDEKEFDSRDKMNLHFTHMISSKIGDEFFPYISFRVIDMDEGKAIIRVDCARCKKPVFLKDGKVEEFYVRSGPSSVMLTGSNLVNYVNNKSTKDKMSIVRKIEEFEE